MKLFLNPNLLFNGADKRPTKMTLILNDLLILSMVIEMTAIISSSLGIRLPYIGNNAK